MVPEILLSKTSDMAWLFREHSNDDLESLVPLTNTSLRICPKEVKNQVLNRRDGVSTPNCLILLLLPIRLGLLKDVAANSKGIPPRPERQRPSDYYNRFPV